MSMNWSKRGITGSLGKGAEWLGSIECSNRNQGQDLLLPDRNLLLLLKPKHFGA